MRCSFRCTDTKKHEVKRLGTRERRTALKEQGRCAFVFPEGTPGSKGRPAYPITTQSGCLDCSLAKAAYMRMSQQLGKRQTEEHKRELLIRRSKLVRLALEHSDPGAQGNACNWSIPAAKRLKTKKSTTND